MMFLQENNMAVKKKGANLTKKVKEVKSKPKFTIFATLKVDVTTTVEAENMVEAAQIAGTLKPTDFVTPKETFNDWDQPVVYSVCSN